MVTVLEAIMLVTIVLTVRLALVDTKKVVVVVEAVSSSKTSSLKVIVDVVEDVTTDLDSTVTVLVVNVVVVKEDVRVVVMVKVADKKLVEVVNVGTSIKAVA